MKTDFSSLDASILEALVERPLRLGEVLAVVAIRHEALRINRRRAGASPSESADITVNERLQVLQRSGRVSYDPATSRWESQLKLASRSSQMQGTHHRCGITGSSNGPTTAAGVFAILQC